MQSKDVYLQEYHWLVAAKFFFIKKVDWEIHLLGFDSFTNNKKLSSLCDSIKGYAMNGDV